jgi:hypothetical protein
MSRHENHRSTSSNGQCARVSVHKTMQQGQFYWPNVLTLTTHKKCRSNISKGPVKRAPILCINAFQKQGGQPMTDAVAFKNLPNRKLACLSNQ